MKLRKNRLVSLLLVLAMVLALVPAVLATDGLKQGTVAFTNGATVAVGSELTLAASCTNEDTDKTPHTITYEIVSGATYATLAGDKLTGVHATESSGAHVTVKATCACRATATQDITVGKATITLSTTSVSATLPTKTADSDAKLR